MFPNLDDCVNNVAYISAEVIFGESGKDVQAESFMTKMREVCIFVSRPRFLRDNGEKYHSAED